MTVTGNANVNPCYSILHNNCISITSMINYCVCIMVKSIFSYSDSCLPWHIHFQCRWIFVMCMENKLVEFAYSTASLAIYVTQVFTCSPFKPWYLILTSQYNSPTTHLAIAAKYVNKSCHI